MPKANSHVTRTSHGWLPLPRPKLDAANENPINAKAISDVPEYEYAVKVGDLQWVRIPPGQSVARPEATRAAQEVTNVLKYSGNGSL